MAKQFYKIQGVKADESRIKVKVLAEKHRQHYHNSTNLIGVSKTGTKKLDELSSQWHLYVKVGGKYVDLESWA